MAIKIQIRRGTAANWTSTNPTLSAGEIAFETDTGKVKIGTGSTAWTSLAYIAMTPTEVGDAITGVINTHNTTTNAHGVADFSVLATTTSPTFTGTVVLPDNTSIGSVSAAEIGVLNGLTASTAELNILDGVTATTTELNLLAGVTATTTELNLLDGVTASTAELNILDGVTASTAELNILDGVTASTAELNTLDGVTVSATELNILDGATLPTSELNLLAGVTATTTELNLLDGVTASTAELNYLDGVTSALQTQLNAKAPTADPTFTGTVSGITKSMVGLGSVNDTADADKPVSTATQTALDAKLSLAGGTMTGKITLDGDPTQALHAVTKQYVDGVEAGIIAKPQVKAATTANITADYNNGTAGVGATLTAPSNAAFPQIDGVSLTTAIGDRGVLVKNQTNAAQNGRYNLTTQGDAGTKWVLTRCSLCDETDEIPGAYVFVTDGTVNGQTGWVQHVDDPATFTVGTDDIDVFQFAGAGTVTAGTNVSVSGNQVSVVAAPTFSGLVTASATGVAFSDGTQTKIGVPSITTISQKTDSYTLSNLNERDSIIEISKGSATTLTIPADSTVNYPVGTTLDIIQTSSGQVTIAGAGGVTVNATPGLKLRTQWSSVTLLKRASNTWLVFGDLTA